MARMRHAAAVATAFCLCLQGASVARTDPQTQAPGQPILRPIAASECAAAKSLYDRYSPGLPVQEEAIERTARLTVAAQHGTRQSIKQLRRTVYSAMPAEVRALVPVLADLKLRIGNIDTRNLSEAQRERRRNALEILANLDQVVSSFEAGKQYGQALVGEKQAAARGERLFQEMKRLNDLLIDSGLLDAMGETLAGTLGARVATTVARRNLLVMLSEGIYRALKVRIDALVLASDAVFDRAVAAKAKQNQAMMIEQYARIRNAVVEAQAVMRECTVQEARTDKRPTPRPTTSPRSGALKAVGVIAGAAAVTSLVLAVMPKPDGNGCGTCEAGSCLNCFEGQGIQPACCPQSHPFYCSGTGKCYTDLGAGSEAAQRQNTTCRLPGRDRRCF